MGDRVGQSGIESQYDRFLRGRTAPAGCRWTRWATSTASCRPARPEPGRQLRLSVDLEVQQAGQEALAAGTGAGAFAVMDVNNGEVVALGSQPSFDPNIFAKIVKEKDLKRLSSEEYGKPLFNRAIQGGYPTGSTFKLITATAAMESGLITPDTVLFDGGSLTVGGVTFKNAGDASYGALALRQALTVSSDVFFYQLGRDMNGSPAAAEVGPAAGRGPPHRDRPPRRGRRPHPGPALAQPAVQGQAHRPALVGGRQHQPVRGPGRHRLQPAADGGGLRHDRQRRPRAAAPAWAAHRGRRRAGAAAARSAGGPQAEDRRRLPPGHPGGHARGGQRRGRHLDRGVQRLPGADRRARPAPRRRASAAPTSPGTSRWRPTPTRSTWSRSPTRRAASAPTPPRRWRGGSWPSCSRWASSRSSPAEASSD